MRAYARIVYFHLKCLAYTLQMTINKNIKIQMKIKMKGKNA